jgi:hypothetical protein
MRKRWTILIVICASVAGGVIWWELARNPEPSYAGRSLSSWVWDHWSTTGDNPDQKIRSPEFYKQAEEAIGKMGTNAIPHLIAWAGYRPPAWKGKVYPQANRVIRKFPTRLRLWDKQHLRALRATYALSRMTTVSDPVLRLIDRLCAEKDPYSVFRGEIILHGLAQRSFEGAMICLTNKSSMTRSVGVIQLAQTRWRTNAHAAVPGLIAILKDSDGNVAASAANALGRLRMEPATVVPALTEALYDTRVQVRANAASALGMYGAVAESALPALAEVANDPDPSVKSNTTSAITRIKRLSRQD